MPCHAVLCHIPCCTAPPTTLVMGSLWAFPNQVVMGLSKKDRRIHLLRKLKYLGQIPVRNGMIYFPEVIYYFSKAVLEAHALGQPRYDKVDLPNSKVRRQAEKEYNRTLRQALRTEVDSHLFSVPRESARGGSSSFL